MQNRFTRSNLSHAFFTCSIPLPIPNCNWISDCFTISSQSHQLSGESAAVAFNPSPSLLFTMLSDWNSIGAKQLGEIEFLLQQLSAERVSLRTTTIYYANFGIMNLFNAQWHRTFVTIHFHKHGMQNSSRIFHGYSETRWESSSTLQDDENAFENSQLTSEPHLTHKWTFWWTSRICYRCNARVSSAHIQTRSCKSLTSHKLFVLLPGSMSAHPFSTQLNTN